MQDQFLQRYIAPESGESANEIMTECVEALIMETVDAGYSLVTTDGRDYLIKAAIKWDLKERDKRTDFFIKRYFWPQIQRITGTELDDIYELLDEYQRGDRKKQHDQILLRGMSSAINLLQEGHADSAKELLAQTALDAEDAIAERPVVPVISVREALPSLRLELAKNQGVKHIGLCQETLPELDNATGGFQGLNLITAKSGEGKTILVTQCALDILTKREDTCCLFISADMLQTRIQMRMLANRARLPITTVRSGTGSLGWTEQEHLQVEAGLRAMEDIGDRIRILDRFNFPHTSRNNITKEMSKLMDATGKEHCLLVIDFLELLYVPDNLKVQDRDEWIIEEIRAIADSMGNDPILCIAESGKADVAGERGNAGNVKGNYRKVMRADCVITLNGATQDELLNNWEMNDHGYLQRRNSKKPLVIDAKDKAEAIKKAVKIRKALDAKGESPIMIKVGKARDGAKKTEFYATNHFERYAFEPLELGCI